MNTDQPQEATATIEIQIDSRLEEVALIGVTSRALAIHAGLSQEDAFAVELCVVEAVTNSVEHGYGFEAGHPVKISVRLTASALEFEVKDLGRGLDADSKAAQEKLADSAQAPPDSMSGRGRGAFLIHELMDNVVYDSTGQGLTLTMSKTLGSPPPPEA